MNLDTSNTRSADPSDIAADIQLNENAIAIANHRLGYVMKPPEGWDGENCFVCEVKLTEVRLNLPSFRCVQCQSALERAKRLYA